MARHILQLKKIKETHAHTLNLRGAMPISARGKRRKIIDIKILPVLKKPTLTTARPSVAPSYARIIAVFLIVVGSGMALGTVGKTVSVFNDLERSSANLFASGVIDFSLTLTPWSNSVWLNMEQGTSSAYDVGVSALAGSNPFQYYASSTNFGGDPDFCGALSTRAIVGSEEPYNGLLRDMLTATTTTLGTWNFEFSTGQNFANRVCHFDTDFNGWQTRHDLPNYEEGGFKDTEKITRSIYSAGLRINKVYFEKEGEEDGGIHTGDASSTVTVINIINQNETDINTCACGDPLHDTYGDDNEAHCDQEGGDTIVVNDNSVIVTNNATATANTGGNNAEGGGTFHADHEWVELYNQTDEEVNISGWTICDNASCDELFADAPIPPHGFAIIAGSAEVWDTLSIPPGVVTIVVSDGAIGDGLGDGTDMLVLKRPDGEIIDQMNWGAPDGSWTNYNADIWNPGVVPPGAGGTLGRVPDGYDTNNPSDFSSLLTVYLEAPPLNLNDEEEGSLDATEDAEIQEETSQNTENEGEPEPARAPRDARDSERSQRGAQREEDVTNEENIEISS